MPLQKVSLEQNSEALFDYKKLGYDFFMDIQIIEIISNSLK